ncbi:hypothetical protein GH811_05785 [Acetobacterium malicum]|uniref:Ethanolamine utilization protein n=1 Tax=Acetobacterium malicum TaxID=52692 RepID=A0ABR6YVK6_9FIRM|nr:hypothetical protein [Acetobacterium malicum]MBC3899125.1 hypothetical protein [Acetobacterium malicum]
MDLELIIDEVFKRIMDKTRQNEMVTEERSTKMFLQCDGSLLSIAGYETVLLDAVKDKNQFRNYEFLVIRELSIDEMAASVSGLSINEKTRVLRQFLLTGKPVYVIEEGLEHRAYKAIANPVFYNLFKEQEMKLIQYGLRIMTAVALESALGSEEKKPSPEIFKKETSEQSAASVLSSDIQYSTVKKLINHELAKQLAVEATIILKTGTLITPYAKDVFKESNTTITFI